MSNKMKGMISMICSAVGFACMQILVAMTAGRVPVFEQMLCRNLVATIIAWGTLRHTKACLIGKPENRKLLLLRCVMGFLGMFCLFYATNIGNQGQVAVLSKLSPFVVIFCAAVFLREKPRGFQIAALLVAMAGAVATAGFQLEGVSLASILAFGSSVFAGIAYFCVGKLKGREDPKVIVFAFSAFTMVVTGLLSIPDFVIPSLRDTILLLGIGVMAAVGQLCLTYSYSVAKASEVSVFNYAGIPVAMVLGTVILHQAVTLPTLLGSALVILSGVISFVGENRVEKQ